MKIYWYNGKKNAVGSNVRRLRKGKKWPMNQRELAERLQLLSYEFDAMTVSRIEKGRRFVADYEVMGLADAPEVPIEELYRDVFKKKPTNKGLTNTMARRKKQRGTLRWIVLLLVVAVAGSCAYLSWSDKHGDGFEFSVDLPASGVLQDLLDDVLGGEPGGGGGAVVSDTAIAADLEVHFLDVGQAESILIKAPKANVLIDAGENNQGDEVIRYLEQNGVRELRYVIGTHPHSDHIGGLDTVIEKMKVKDVILPTIPEAITPTTQTYTDLLLAIATKGLKITPAKAGKSYDLGGGVQMKILGPAGEYRDLNNMSVVVKLTYGSTSFLLTGDAENGAERDLLDSGANLGADVLGVGHHGSNTSTSQSFFDAVGPSIAVISCGIDNSYGHPHREIIERLEARSVSILRTDFHGAVVVASDGEQLAITTQR